MGGAETTKAILAPLLEESEVLVSVDKISEVRAMVDEEIKSLGRTMKLLSKVSKIHAKALEKEMKMSTQEKWDWETNEPARRRTEPPQPFDRRRNR